MSERIRVEIHEDMGSDQFKTTFVGEALSTQDAVAAAMEALEAYDEMTEDDDGGDGIEIDRGR